MRIGLLVATGVFGACSVVGALLMVGGDKAEAVTLQNRPARTCTLYENRDYGGAHWTLRNGDYMIMINEPDVGTSDGIFRRIYQPSWNDKVPSFRLRPGCTLTLWQHVNRGGARFRANRSRTYVGSAWNDQASEALCTCGGLPNY